jgi:hypothetical protein
MTFKKNKVFSEHQNDPVNPVLLQMPKEFIWLPDSGGDVSGDLRVNALPAFNQPISVLTSRTEMLRIIERLKTDGKQKQIAVSNGLFKKGLYFDPTGKDLTSEEFQRFCGDVIVFYCVRFVLDGRGIPCLEDAEQEKGPVQ